jgi:PQQ-dependent dehydrogenase (methanol/ethanol family)
MRLSLIKQSAFAVGLLVALPVVASANDELLKMQQNSKDWVMQNGNYSSTRYSELKQITKENVKNLQPAWTFSTGVLRGHEGGPLVMGDVMYVHTPFPNIVYALDLNEPGKVIWKYEPKQDPDTIPVMCCDTVNRGVAYADGKIFLHQADTTLVALDAKTGQEVWKVANGDPKKAETGTSAPYVIKDKVIIGISGGEFGVRGSVTAYNIKDGKREWRAYSMGPDADTLMSADTTSLGKPVGKDSGTATWEGDQWKIGGGTTWGWYSYDPDLNLFYYGSGNPSTWNPVQRPGDNRWSMTIFARDPDNGMAKCANARHPRPIPSSFGRASASAPRSPEGQQQCMTRRKVNSIARARGSSNGRERAGARTPQGLPWPVWHSGAGRARRGEDRSIL